MSLNYTFTQEEYNNMADKMDKAADILNSTIKRYPNQFLAMLSTTISQPRSADDETCKTTACIGGFYYLGQCTEPVFTKHPIDHLPILYNDNGKQVCYSQGAEMLAKDTGFTNEMHIRIWAKNNAAIWGNNNGDSLFSSTLSYGISDYNSMTVKIAVTHLHAVAERMRNPDKRVTVSFQ